MSVPRVGRASAPAAPRQDEQPADTKRVSTSGGLDVGIVHTSAPIGDIAADFEQFMAFVRGERSDRPHANATERLKELLPDGGPIQLQALRYYNHQMNDAIVRERFSEQKVQPTEQQVAEAVALLDEESDWEILSTLSAAEKGGTLGKSQAPSGIIYNGVDLSKIEFAKDAINGKVPLMPADVASLTDAECSSVVAALLGPSGGGPELAKIRADLKGDGSPAALAKLGQFDRGLLATLGSNLIAASQDPQYAKQLGIEFPSTENADGDGTTTGDETTGGNADNGEIPDKYKGNLLMLLAYVFAMADDDITKRLEKAATEYNKMNHDLKEGKQKKGNEPLSNSITYKQWQVKAIMTEKENNVGMGTSMMDAVSAANKRMWG